MTSSTEAVSTPAIADHPVRAALLLGALGVVFGDIGTSPIYAFRESLKAAGGASEAAVFGVLSLVFWAIALVVAIKYVVFVRGCDLPQVPTVFPAVSRAGRASKGTVNSPS